MEVAYCRCILHAWQPECTRRSRANAEAVRVHAYFQGLPLHLGARRKKEPRNPTCVYGPVLWASEARGMHVHRRRGAGERARLTRVSSTDCAWAGRPADTPCARRLDAAVLRPLPACSP
eukprot:scaffold155439_cov31-Tisochrysis_lutea.AAC.2